MAMHANDNKLPQAIEIISEQGFAGIADAMRLLIDQAMLVERTRYLQAEHYERNENRQDYANGFKPKTVKTRVGELELSVPQVRSCEFYPSFLEKGVRSERALTLSLAEMYVQGVSTRKVKAILQELCGLEVSSSEVSRATKLLDEELSTWRTRKLGQYEYLIVDARYEKVRQNGVTIDTAILLAYGINSEGKREILGVSSSLSEAETHWRKFLESLNERGLHGVKLIISDAHSGLKAALRAVFPSIPWQRCQFHLQQNAQAHVTSTYRKAEVAESIRAIFDAENLAEANRLLELTAQKYEKDMPKLAEWIRENLAEGLTVFNFSIKHRKRLRTSNMAERVNQEIKRRTRVVRTFPSVESSERLITAIVMEISEDWMSGKAYLSKEDK